MVKATVIEVAVEDAKQRNLYFAPLQRRIRGRLDFSKVAEPQARITGNSWPGPIAGQVLGINIDSGEAWLREPLHDAQNEVVAETIKKKGMRLPPEREIFKVVHVPTWLHFLKAAVDGGQATVIAGELPETIDGQPTLRFLTQPGVDVNDRLADALAKQAAALDRLADVLGAK